MVFDGFWSLTVFLYFRENGRERIVNNNTSKLTQLRSNIDEPMHGNMALENAVNTEFTEESGTG